MKNYISKRVSLLRLTNTILAFILFTQLNAQDGIIKGRVFNSLTNEPLPFAAVLVNGTDKVATTDLDGNYEIVGLSPGLYNIEAQFIGFQRLVIYEIQITRSRPAVVNFAMKEAAATLEEVVVSSQTQFEERIESPVSLKTLGINEIQRNPGGNQDISRVIQALPGVASTVAFRNDLVIRGGGPNENRFFLDGIEIPAINHFATQGSSGGPVGMINVNFIREVDFYTGAFPAERGNTLSSLMEIKLKEGNPDKIAGIFQVSASDVGLTLDGPLGPKTTFLASARRSYLQFLFSVLELPFLPTYNDFQFKVKHKFSDKSQLTLLGLGALDQFRLNLEANETPEQQYILNYLPVNEQWNYSIGAKYTQFHKSGYTDIVLSRFMLNNVSFKYFENDPSQLKLLDYQSQEIENKLRVENTYSKNRWTLTSGFGFEEAKYNTFTVNRQFADGFVLNYESDLRLYKYAAFARVNKSFFKEKLALSAGFRTDGLTFNDHMSNPLNQFSPRVSAKWNITDALSVSGNWGIFYQQPPYTTLGFRNGMGDLVNADMKFIRSEHFILGTSYLFPFSARFTVEGFYKGYSQYPFLLIDSVSLANLGTDFGVIGNQPATSTSNGAAYGFEVSYEQKLFKGFYGIAAYTYVRSEFEDRNGNVIPSTWDFRNLVSITGGKRFKGDWEIGLQYQFLGGAPFTPFDVEATGLVVNWDAIGRGIPNFALLNTGRLDNFNRVNIRIDKKWFFENYNLNIFLDVQNLLGQALSGPPFIDAQRDALGNPIIDPNNAKRYLTTSLENSVGTALPSIGLIFQF
ncbi:MAG: TonB-dependent receptor [Schleiferiaceae bacterium]|nr:TonB-dependent receptor [Schleiferiaceae bacterium]